VLRSFFGKPRPESERLTTPTVLSGPRIPRHSSGWSALMKQLKDDTNLRFLDIGPTSPNNINFLTGMGHSVYMADLVHEARTGNWQLPANEGEESAWNVEGFLDQNLNFSGRTFDVVLLWTTLDYLPEPLIAPVIERFHQSMNEGGRILALFHSRMTGGDTAFYRYHLTEGDEIVMQESEAFPIERVLTNRNIEKLFQNFAGYKFFLAKDNVYEVIITR
jgi:Methyltransferase domain